jgi:hypothetical protein
MTPVLKGYVVMLHHQVVGTFAPFFCTLDEAEEFSNALRIITNDVAVSEPVPVVDTKGIILDAEDTEPATGESRDWDKEYRDYTKTIKKRK